MKAKKRTCLKCGKRFMSAGPANRICHDCQRINANLPRFSEVELQYQRGVKRHNGFIISDLYGVVASKRTA
jgi:hypothetical protein